MIEFYGHRQKLKSTASAQLRLVACVLYKREGDVTVNASSLIVDMIKCTYRMLVDMFATPFNSHELYPHTRSGPSILHSGKTSDHLCLYSRYPSHLLCVCRCTNWWLRGRPTELSAATTWMSTAAGVTLSSPSQSSKHTHGTHSVDVNIGIRYL